MAKEIDQVLFDGRWRMIENCRIYRSAQFINTDNRLVAAILKLHLKSGRMVQSQPRLDDGKLKDERVAVEFSNSLISYEKFDFWHALLTDHSAQFLNSDHRLVVATLKLQLKSERMVPSQPWLDVGKLKDERVAEEFVNRVSGDLGGLGTLGNPEEL